MKTIDKFLILKESIYEEFKEQKMFTLEDKMDFLFEMIRYHKEEKQENLVLTSYIVLGEILGIGSKVDFVD